MSTGEKLIAESLTEITWGTGLHLRDPHALDKRFWKKEDGGLMCEIYGKLRSELRKKE